MAVIVVGDIDRDAVAAMIKAHFSSLSSPSPRRPRPVFDVPDHPGTRYAVVSDKETTATTVQLSDLRPARNQGSVGGYRDLMRDQLFADMFGSRLDELAQSANPPFLRAAAGRRLFPAPRTRDEAILQALVANDGVARGLDALVTELQRLARFGFTATELARAKRARMNDYERAVTESPDRESDSRADEYTRNFLQSEALPTIWQELAFHRRFIPGITLNEINALTRDWFPDQNRLVVVTAPDAAGIALPDQSQLANVVKTAIAKRLDPYVDAASGEALVDAPPSPGTIVKTTARDGGITEWTLSNGATVVLKPTTLKEDQILFRAVAPGGTSLASDADFVAARVADDVVAAGGAGRFSAVMLDKILTGKAVAVRPFVGETSQGMGGGSTPQDLETLFQLLYLRFTQPRADPVAFAAMQAQARALLANRMASPDAVFNQTIDTAVSGNHARRQPETPATVDQWDLNKSMAFYKARFADASNFTFVFVGSFTVDAIKPLVETWLASLPATHANERWRDVGIVPPTGIIDQTIQKGIAPKSQVAIVLSGPFEYDEPHQLAFRTATLLLQSRLTDTIRQELGGTYSITVNPDADKFPASDLQRADRVDVRPRTHGGARTARVRRDRLCQEHGDLATPADGDPRGAASRIRGEQPGQPVRARADRAGVRGRRRGTRRRGETAGADRIADRRGDPAGGADLPRYAKLRESHPDARDEIAVGRINHAPSRQTPAPAIEMLLTCSCRTRTPSSSDTTGMMKLFDDARVAPRRPAAVASTAYATPVPSTPSAISDASEAAVQCACGDRGSAERQRQDERPTERPPHDRQRAVALLQRPREAVGEGVRHERRQNHQHAARLTAHRARAGETGKRDQNGAGEPDGQTECDAPRRGLPSEQARDEGGEDRRRAVQHAGQRRRHMLLGEREHAERKREPQHAERSGLGAVLGQNRAPRRRHQRQRGEPERNPHDRDAHRRDGLQSFGNEEERRAPDQSGDDDQQRVEMWCQSSVPGASRGFMTRPIALTSSVQRDSSRSSCCLPSGVRR